MPASRAKPQSSSTNESQTFDETKWVIQICRTLDEELEDDDEAPVNIFSIPKLLVSSNPELYTPQQAAIGPYHHWRPELYEMERYKIMAAKRTRKKLHSISYHDLVDQIVNLESRIRACYHKYLDFKGETLAWMMAIDASFLLEFLQIYVVQQGKIWTRVSSRMSHLMDYAGRKSGHNAILRDVVMLENQIPLFILRKILEFQFASLEEADDVLNSMLIGFCKEISPFKAIKDLPRTQVSGSGHILDFLYHIIVAIPKQPSEIAEDDDQENDDDSIEEQGNRKASSSPSSSDNTNYLKQLCDTIWDLLSKLNDGPIQFLKRLLLSSPARFLLKLPWAIISRIPIVCIFIQPIRYLFFSEEKEANPKKETEDNNGDPTKPPLVEEIAIPSVMKLSKAGFRFSPSDGGDISGISLDTKTLTLYLPTVSLDVNSEVVIRNLVAYEASNASGPLIFTRYTELMNGIIDDGDDVRVLREAGVVVNRMKSDVEVAGLWNGMSKSIRLTKVPSLDKVIEDVNRCYNASLRVKICKYMRSYVFGSWRLLTLFACVMVLLMMSLQACCSVYNCARLLSINTTKY